MYNGRVSLALLTQPATDRIATDLLEEWAQDADRIAAAKHKNPEIAHRTLLGRSLIRALIDRGSEANGRNCQFATERNGKPYILMGSGKMGPAISISHSGGLIVGAVTNMGALGVDVEEHQPRRSFNEIASFAFGPREAHAAVRTPQDFYRIWCLREAMSKASGMGLAEATDRIDRTQHISGNGAWQMIDGSSRWLLAHVNPAEGYSLAVAVRRDISRVHTAWTEESLDLWYP